MIESKIARKSYYTIVFLQLFVGEITGTIFTLYMLYKGFNLFDVNIVIAVFFVSIFFLEIPTGAIADLYGRRVSVALGFLFYGLSSTIFLLTNSLISFIVAEIFSAIGLTLQSGALEAWIVDYLNYHNKEDKVDLESLFSNAGMIRQSAGVVCGLLGAYIANINFKFPWELSIVLSLTATVLTYFLMKEPYFKKKVVNLKNSNSSISEIVKDSINYGLKNKSISIFFVIGILISFSNSAANTFQQPRLVGLFGNEIWIMGWIKGAYSLFIIFGSWLIGYLSKKEKNHHQLLFYSCFMIGFWLILSGTLNTFPSVLTVFLIYEIGRGMYNPAVQIFLNARIHSDKRATILSFVSSISQIGMVSGLIVTGIISKNFTSLSSTQWPIRVSWIVCGISAIVASFISVIIRNREKYSCK